MEDREKQLMFVKKLYDKLNGDVSRPLILTVDVPNEDDYIIDSLNSRRIVKRVFGKSELYLTAMSKEFIDYSEPRK